MKKKKCSDSQVMRVPTNSVWLLFTYIIDNEEKKSKSNESILNHWRRGCIKIYHSTDASAHDYLRV